MLTKQSPETKIVVCEPSDAPMLTSHQEQKGNADGTPAAAPLLPSPARADEPGPPVVRAIEIEGASAFSRAEILRALRLKPGGTLRRTPEAIETLLEDRYELRRLPANDPSRRRGKDKS